MGLQRFTNLATGTLAAAITSGATSLSLTSGEGALFPTLSAGDWFMAVLVTAGQSASSTSEIVKCTARSTDTLTIVRGQEGTTASAWNAGDTCTLINTAGTMAGLAQPGTIQAQAGNFALDTGTANAYAVALTPALTAHAEGVPIRWMAAHGSTGSSTFNDGAGAAPLVLPNSAALPAGAIVAGGIYETIWTGAEFMLVWDAASGLLGSPGQVLANFLARYDASGYFYANYFNQSSGNNENPNVSQVIVTDGADNFFRKSSVGHVFGGFSTSASGYYQLPNGFIFQYGILQGVNGGAGPVTLTFPITFPNFCFAVVASSKHYGTGSVGTGQVQNLSNTPGTTMSTSGAIVTCDRDGDGYQRAFWLALGY